MRLTDVFMLIGFALGGEAAKEDTENAQLHEQRAVALAEEMGNVELVASVPSMRERMEARQEGA